MQPRSEVRIASFADLDTTTLYELLRLRCEVFVVEQECAYADVDGRDMEPATRHLWIPRDGVPVAYLRILGEPDGVQRIGRVAVAKPARGDRLATKLMVVALTVIGNRPAVLDAQTYLTRFYLKYGFAVSGPEYVEDGIPHVPMSRPARA